jgi:hypothetical protein
MSFTILLSNSSAAPMNPDLQTYLQKYQYVVVPPGSRPQDAFTLAPAASFILWWDASLIPQATLADISSMLDLTKVNVTWDSYARNYPHKVTKRYSERFFGVPAFCAPALQNARHLDEFFASAPLYRLPSDLNVCAGFREYDSARLRVGTPARSLVRVFDPRTGLYK